MSIFKSNNFVVAGGLYLLAASVIVVPPFLLFGVVGALAGGAVVGLGLFLAIKYGPKSN